MIFVALFALSAAAAPPAGLDLSDPGPWEDRYVTLRDGPPGCWDFTGDLSLKVTLNTSPDLFSLGGKKSWVIVGTFQGRLEDGTWTRFVQQVADPDTGKPMRLAIRTLVGKLDESIIEAPGVARCENGTEGSFSIGNNGVRAGSLSCRDDTESSEATAGNQAPTDIKTANRKKNATDDDHGGASSDDSSGFSPENLLRRAIDDWSSVGTAAVDWSEKDRAVRLFIDASMIDEFEGKTLSIVARFPEGGLHPTSIVATWPRTVRLGDRPFRVTLRDTQAHIRGTIVQDAVLPTVESLSLVASVLGFTGGMEQRINYRTAKRCVATSTPTLPNVAAPAADESAAAE